MGEEKKRGFWKGLEIGVNLSMFVQDFTRLLKKKARASKDKRFQGMTQTLDFFK